MDNPYEKLPDHTPVKCEVCEKTFKVYNAYLILYQRQWSASCSQCRTHYLFRATGRDPIQLQITRLSRVVTLDEQQGRPFPWETGEVNLVDKQ